MKLELSQEDARMICAVALVASKDSARPVIQGLLIDGPTVVATDSYRLAFGKIANDDEGGSVLLPAAEVAKALAPACKSKMPSVLVVEGSEWSVAVGGTTTTGRVVEGTFPNWRELVPADTTEPCDQSGGYAAAFNPQYLATLAKAGAILAGSSREALSGGYCAKITLRDSARPVVFRIQGLTYLLMPVRVQ